MVCTYLLGVNDDGTIYGLDKKNRHKSMKNIRKMVSGSGIDAYIDSIHVRKLKDPRGYIIQVNICSPFEPEEFVC